MSLDRVAGDADLYIGGLFSLRRKEALKNASITHVVSVLTLPLDLDLFEGYKHLVVDINDVEDENILQHFPATNAFIHEGLDAGAGVLVHCAMGKSRSVTVLIAYLLSTDLSLDPKSALNRVRVNRPFAEPNQGFLRQLDLYHNMHCPEDIDNHPVYQRWLYQRTVDTSNACGVAPDADNIHFSDLSIEFKDSEEQTPPEDSRLTYRCRRCRAALATSAYLIPHDARTHGITRSKASGQKNMSTSRPLPSPVTTPVQCAHLFVDPLSWMRPELEKGLLEGRLECPNAKCGQNVGKYAWQGMKCSCGEWVVPGICIARAKVDEIPYRRQIGVRERI